MMSYVYDSFDFKKYLSDKNKNIRVEGLSVWINTIPIPVDIFNSIFEKSDHLFRVYLDHILAILVVDTAVKNKDVKNISVKDFPNGKELSKEIAIIGDCFKKLIKNDNKNISKLINELSDGLGISNYRADSDSIKSALSHTGKKYKRLYFPNTIKNTARRYFPKSGDCFVTTNGDMFGNIIADEMGMYRSGFSDALSYIFNKLLDFKLEECSGVMYSKNRVSLINIHGEINESINERVIFERTSDGSFWEPVYDGSFKVKINSSHPYYKKISEYKDELEAFYQFLLKLSEYEAKAISSSDVKSLESMRLIISRELWLENDE